MQTIEDVIRVLIIEERKQYPMYAYKKGDWAERIFKSSFVIDVSWASQTINRDRATASQVYKKQIQ